MKRTTTLRTLFFICLTVGFANFASAFGISFTTNNNNGCAPLTVTFTNTSNDPSAYRYEWNFGDNTPTLVDTLSTTITHTFVNPGQYYPYLQVYDINGNYIGYANSSNAISANGPYFYTPDSVCANDVVNFYPNGGPFNSYLWTFGDGNASSQEFPSHTYSAPGVKTVSLTTSGACGTQTTSRTLKISTLIVPYPYISANPSGTTCTGVPIEFNTSDYASYSWNFGGGATANIKNPTYAYTTIGSKTITLNVTNNCNQTGTTTYNTFITNTPPPFPAGIYFYGNQNLACPNSNIGFNAQPGFSNYEYNFGDGSPIVTSSNSYKDHQYGNTLGTYIASVKITAPCGNDTTLYDTVTISNNAPFPQNQNYMLGVNSSPSCPNSNVSFYAPSGFNSYQWNFGDGAIINTTDSYANHTYGNAITTYSVSVKVTNNCGNDTTLYSTVIINGTLKFPNTASFNVTSNPSSSCPNSDIYFQAPYGYNSYLWTFGDGSPSVTSQYSGEYHKYTNVGIFGYTVQITNGCGNDTILYGTVNIVANQNFPTSNFELNHNPQPASCPNDFVHFSAPHGYPYYEWNFGDGSPTEIAYNDNNRNHKFSGNNASYVVSVKIKNGCGNMTTLFDTVYINNNVGFDNTGLEFYAYETTICAGTNVGFNAPGGYSNYEWNFGDNTGTSFSSSNYFNHIFGNQIDTLTVSVKITNGCGIDTTLYTYINVVGNMMFPTSNFEVTHNPEPACPNDFVNFNAPYGFPYYEWNFGDGSPILVGDQNYTNHKFGTNPLYIVSLKIKNGCGNDTVLYDTVHISSTVGFPTGTNFNLSTNESEICPGSNAYFNAPYGYNSYEWNFGDNSPIETSSYSGFNHYYGNQVTTYTVSVKITNGCGVDTTLYTTIEINSNIGFPMGTWFNVQAGPNPACPNDMVGFEAPGGYDNYKWTFGDGDSIASTQNQVGHKYINIGTYNYSVKIKNACGKDTTLYGTVQISTSSSTQNFIEIQTENEAPSCPNDLVSFYINQNGYSNYYWYFSDGDTVVTNGNNIQHAFDSVGTYTVICKIINGCGDTIQGQKTVQVVNNNPINNSLNISSSPNPACPNDVVFFNIENGQSSNQYIWNFGDGSPSDTTIGVGLSHVYTTVGTKTITVIATNACGSSKTLTLTQVIGAGNPPELQSNGSPNWGPATSGGGSNNTVGCAGDAIVFYFQGTSAQNQWSFGDGSTGIATETIVVDGGDGSFPVTIIKHVFPENGQFTIQLTLTNGCGLSVTDSMVINIGGGQAVNGTMTTSQPPFTTCAPIDFIALGGANYSWNFGDSTTLNSSSPTVSHTYSNPGIYVASVVITNGCGNSAIYTKVVNVTGVSGPQISLISSNSPNCSGANNGYASVTAAGGEAPYTYAWNDANAQNTSIATNLSSGLYNVTVTDNIGCSSVLAVSITDPAAIVVSTSTTQSTCGSATGSATATVVSGGTTPYTYYWSPVAATTASISNVAYGTYTVTVSDNNGCQVTENVTVSDANSATVDSDSIVNVSCNGGNNGAIYITVSGTATYTYAWSNGATTQNITGLAAGSYSVQITGNNGCSAVYSATVSEASTIQVQTTTVVAPTCGNFDGIAGANVTGGSAPFAYLWDAGTGSQTTVNATGLPAGTYSVIVTDANGCTDSADISLSNLNAPQLSAVITDISCNGDTDGAINLSVTGGTSPYLYTWNVPPPQTNNQDLNSLAGGNYLIFVNDAQGCLSVRTYTIAEPATLGISISATGATCSLNNASAIATVTGGTAPYTYTWSSSDTTATADSLTAGAYTLIVTDDNSCVAYDSTTVETMVATPSICMVTVDEGSINNEIYWDKTTYVNVDSFIVYREVSSNLYKRIGAVDYTALSTFTDTTRSVGPANGDPNVSTYRYKIQIRDNCGNYSDMSPYHNTVYIQFDENTGVFSWNPSYTIEGGAPTPVANYILICDTTNNAQPWFEVGTTAGTQNTVADNDYNDHKNHPDVAWRVKTDWNIDCEATRAIINTSRSNIKRPSIVVIGIDALNTDNLVSVYPNPATDNLTIELVAVAGINKVFIMNALGQVMYSDSLQGVGTKVKKQINTSAYPKGIYSLVLENGNQRIIKKLVIN